MTGAVVRSDARGSLLEGARFLSSLRPESGKKGRPVIIEGAGPPADCDPGRAQAGSMAARPDNRGARRESREGSGLPAG